VELKDRLAGLARALPPAQRAGVIAAALVLLMAAVPFVRWVTEPSYTLLYAGLEDRQLAQVTSELDARGVPFQLQGSRILVPQDQLHLVRANLAEAGVSASPPIAGYELLDQQALGVSDFRQRVDLQRAVEGELARTLGAMDAIESATVRLVLPEDPLFTDQRTPATASVLIRPARTLDRTQIEAVTLLVSSAVEGLETEHITVADTSGAVLHAPGDAGSGGVGDRQQQRTRDFEAALAAELTQLLQRATDAPASVVVRATLDLDETETQTEVFDRAGVTLREQVTEERYEGTGPVAGGTVGVDGGPLLGAAGEGSYEKQDATREFGVGRTTTRTVQAPGGVQQLSVALVVDEGARAADGELRDLVTAAAGIDPARGDRIAITRVAAPPAVETPSEPAGLRLLELLPRLVALLVLLVIALALFLMSRRRQEPTVEPSRVVPARVQALPEVPSAAQDELPAGPTVKDEVAELVERQPEEIAALLRGWLADRRPTA
jgi:flagellar M-ring protein FliF